MDDEPGASDRVRGESPAIDTGFYELLAGETDLPALASFGRPPRSRAERLSLGKDLRRSVPRAAHADFVRDPALDPVALIAAQNAGQVPDLVPLRHGRMLASPFAFQRGADAIMAADLAASPVTGTTVAACGDMHLVNFGLFASAERQLIFAINDFDAVHSGPWEWDLKRLAASAAVAARHLGHDAAGAQKAARAAVAACRRHIRRYSRMGFLEVWYDRVDEAAILAALPRDYRHRAEALMRKARGKGHQRSLGRLTETADGRPRFVERPPRAAARDRDHGRRPAATGDRRHAALLLPLAARGPPAAAHPLPRRRCRPQGRGRGQRRHRLRGGADAGPRFRGPAVPPGQGGAALGARPLFRHPVRPCQPGAARRRGPAGHPGFAGHLPRLGWGDAGRHYYVRQLSDMKGGVNLEPDDATARAGLADYCGLCGRALALSHAKSGDATVIAGYCGRSEALDAAIGRFAIAYADQTERDHAAFDQARRDGRIAADTSE